MRVKLITAVLTLVAIALLTISVAGLGFLRSYLLGQADSALTTLADSAPHVEDNVSYDMTNSRTQSQPGLAVGWLPASGSMTWVNRETVGYTPTAAGGLSITYAPVPNVSRNAGWLSGEQIATVGGPSGYRFRVLALPEVTIPGPGGVPENGQVILAWDVTTAYQTLGKLTGIDIIVSSILLAAIAVIGVTVIRASLRPLAEIEKTAQAIAAGELSRRVPDLDPQTEVGRLGNSLNTMLTQIEAAFQARSASEAAARKSEDKMRQFVADASHELRTPLTAIRGFAEYYRQRGGVRVDVVRPPAIAPAPARAQLPAGTAPASTAQASTAQASTAQADAAAEPAWADAGAGGGAITATTDATETEPGGLAPPELDRIMRRVEQEASRMGVLVEDMLLLARLDQQRPLEHRTVDLLTLAADAVHDARVVAPDRTIQLTVGAGAALLVLGDEVRLRQVIGNLMSNALAHTPDGTPIDVRIRSGSLDEARSPGRFAPPRPPAQLGPAGPAPLAGQPDILTQPGGPGSPDEPSVLSQPGAAGQAAPPARPGPPGSQNPPGGPAAPPRTGSARPRSAAVLEVTDHGPGLTPEQAERVFERFYRADQARTSGGSGLGLAIVASLVAAHHGAVWVESRPGAGATFRIALPLAPEAMHDDEEDGDPGELTSLARPSAPAPPAPAAPPGPVAPPTRPAPTS
jgi:signal transduction histidine kinase